MLPVPEESFGRGSSIKISPTSKCSTYIIVVGALFVYCRMPLQKSSGKWQLLVRQKRQEKNDWYLLGLLVYSFLTSWYECMMWSRAACLLHLNWCLRWLNLWNISHEAVWRNHISQWWFFSPHKNVLYRRNDSPIFNWQFSPLEIPTIIVCLIETFE